MRPLRATIDFETRSACSLKKCGSWRYSLDPTTEVLCLAFRLPYWPKGETALWHPAFPHLEIEEGVEGDHTLAELFHWILDGDLVEAHNAWFERGIWTNIMTPKMGWPLISPEQWKCSAAKAAAVALPRKLEDAGRALNLTTLKDVQGHKVMLKVSKPRKPRKKEREIWIAIHGRKGMPILWHESLDLFLVLWSYCCQDILAEEALSLRLPDLSAHEQEMYALDQTVNERGFRLDQLGIKAALKRVQRETVSLNKELSKVTKGKVKRATQRSRMLKWFQGQGLEIYDTKKETIDTLLDTLLADVETLRPDCRKGLEIIRSLGRSSTAKYSTMREWICLDERIHGGLLYHGATTGRWTGAGVQPHNFVKGALKTNELMEAAWAEIRSDCILSTPMETLSHALRGAVIASPGKQLYVADYSSIEARVLLWLADDQVGMDLFRRGGDLYLDMASTIYGRPITEKGEERALGKVAILGLGYQMGWSKFMATAFLMEKLTISEELAQTTVNAYREKYWRVKDLWDAQNIAAINAVRTKKPITCGKIIWLKEDIFLYCVLPSGRRLAYPYPLVQDRETPWGEKRAALTFMGIDPIRHQWVRQHAYGGSLVENIVQATARDLMAEAMLRCERDGIYDLILTVHDELVAEAHPALGDVSTFEDLMAECPKWAKGCPIACEGWTGFRYHK